MRGLHPSVKAPWITLNDRKIIQHLKVKLLSPKTWASCCLQSDFLFFSWSEGKINGAQSGEILVVFPIHLWFETLDALRQLDTPRYWGESCPSLNFHHTDFIMYYGPLFSLWISEVRVLVHWRCYFNHSLFWLLYIQIKLWTGVNSDKMFIQEYQLSI